MKTGVASFAVFVILSGCGGGQSRGVEPSCCAPPQPKSEVDTDLPPETGTTDQAASAKPAHCAAFEQAEGAAEKFERGKALVKSCDESCMKSREGGAKRNDGLALLKDAAEAGYLEAQSFYGQTKFTDLMTTGFEPALEAEYVEAMYYLSLASRRGDEAASDLLPQFSTLSLEEDGSFSEELTEPLSRLDEAWVKAALGRAEQSLACFPE